MAPKSRVDLMVGRLRDMQAGTPDVEASAIVSVDGLIIASSLPAGVEEDRVSAMSAAMLSLGERISAELGRGRLDQVYIHGKQGYSHTLEDNPTPTIRGEVASANLPTAFLRRKP
ncbi:MAG: roadblock/LC7 domain-containing protein [Chloroflexi bacterium]|nr:roadblock/LC7 domain-containing protein [Chloroflexota bacterium]